jgi:hypothetical protein
MILSPFRISTKNRAQTARFLGSTPQVKAEFPSLLRLLRLFAASSAIGIRALDKLACSRTGF